MTQKQLVRQNGFNLIWQNDSVVSEDSVNDYYPMRDWQKPAFELLKNSPHMILNAPTGSGKSWMMCLLSAFKMRKDNSLRTIIAVPQTIIASGFLEAKIEMPDAQKTKIHWKIKHNLCNHERLNKGTVNYIIKWLSSTPKSFDDRTIICTHATLLSLYKELKTTNKLSLLNNFLLWVDEAHHVKNNEIEGLNDTIVNNGLGELIAYFLAVPAHSVEIGLTTASFYRGDRCSLLTSNMESKFKRFNLPYDEYLKTMKYLRSFNIDFLLCGANYVKAIELIIKQRKGKDIIYIPHPVSRYSSGDKHAEVKNIITAYQAIHGEAVSNLIGGLLVLSHNDTTFKVLDLVDVDYRSQKKEMIKDLKKKETLDLIIALGMFKEGADWIWADRSIIVGSRSSLVDIIQMIGRLFRDAPGKEHVEVIQLLPFALDQHDEENFKYNLNNYLKALYASLILENILKPVKIKMNDRTRASKESTSEDASDSNKDWLGLALPDSAKQQTMIEDVSNHLVDIAANNPDAFKQVSELRNGYEKIIPKILERHGVTVYEEEVADQIWNMLTRRSLSMRGVNVEEIDFEIIQNSNPLEFLIRYTSGTCSIDTFQKLREAIQASRLIWRTFEEAKNYVQSLGIKSESQWQLYVVGKMPHLPTKPNDIPKAPWAAYEQEWISMGDFLGTNQIAPRFKQYASYDEASAFAKALNLKRKVDWFLYLKGKVNGLPPLPDNIPAAPDKTYKRDAYGKRWIGWGDFLGLDRISNHAKAKGWRSYEDAQPFVRSLELKGAKDWLLYVAGKMPHLPSLPNDIPKKPDQVYAGNGWVDWSTFLGSPISKLNHRRPFWPFEKSRAFVHKLGLKNQREWNAYCAGEFKHLPAKPLEIPSNPAKKYKNVGWITTKDWLGY